jgi:hypothetical protein
MWVTPSNFLLELLERRVAVVSDAREIAPRATLRACIAYSPSDRIFVGETSARSKLRNIAEELIEGVRIV